jgi:chromosome transmission fidelity protein 8
MAEIILHAPSKRNTNSSPNPLPQLLQTPSGLAILEIQGTVNLPDLLSHQTSPSSPNEIPIGRLVFPFYDAKQPDGGANWMKKVWLYVGKHQRLTGEVKKLPKALAVIRKRRGESEGDEMAVDGDVRAGGEGEGRQDLEVVEIVKYKILFSLRPEPVGT